MAGCILVDNEKIQVLTLPCIVSSPLSHLSLPVVLSSLYVSHYVCVCVYVGVQVINRSPKYKNKYVHRRTSVSVEQLTPAEVTYANDSDGDGWRGINS
jgi:hypothetical protein